LGNRAVIISGGTISDYEYIKSQLTAEDTIICADSGYNHAVKMGLAPHIVVGDFDSAGEMPADIACLPFPAKKNFTDTEIAIEYARENGFADFLLLAATGTRLDHSLTNIFLLKSFVERGENAVIINEHNKIRLTNSRLRINEPEGTIVSLLPLTDCVGVTTQNLEYPLHNATLLVGKGLGVSNVAKKEAAVSVKEGLLLVIVARD
jgi:thiamine pyrophosphokinase